MTSINWKESMFGLVWQMVMTLMVMMTMMAIIIMMTVMTMMFFPGLTERKPDILHRPLSRKLIVPNTQPWLLSPWPWVMMMTMTMMIMMNPMIPWIPWWWQSLAPSPHWCSWLSSWVRLESFWPRLCSKRSKPMRTRRRPARRSCCCCSGCWPCRWPGSSTATCSLQHSPCSRSYFSNPRMTPLAAWFYPRRNRNTGGRGRWDNSRSARTREGQCEPLPRRENPFSGWWRQSEKEAGRG